VEQRETESLSRPTPIRVENDIESEGRDTKMN
jgi:hypothetical protein